VRTTLNLISLTALLLLGTAPTFAQSADAAGNPAGVVSKTLSNGLRVLVKPERGTGLVSVVVLIGAGAAQETNQTAGLGNLVANMLFYGTASTSAAEVATIANEVGGSIDASWHQDYTRMRVIITAPHFGRAVSLLGELLSEATFDERNLEATRSKLLARTGTKPDSTYDQVVDAVRELLYEDNGYRRPAAGHERVLRSATSSDLKTFFRRYYVPQNMVVCVVGDVEPPAAIERVDRAFQRLPMGGLTRQREIPYEKLDRTRNRVAEADTNMAHLAVAWLAPGVRSADYPAMLVASNALGGGKGSLLFREIRQKMAVGYELGTVYPNLANQSFVMAYVVTDPTKRGQRGQPPTAVADEIGKRIEELAASLKTDLLSEKDLNRAKGYTIGQYILGRQRMVERADQLAWNELMLGSHTQSEELIGRLDKVTAADVKRVAATYFGNCAVVLMLPKTDSPPSSPDVKVTSTSSQRKAAELVNRSIHWTR